MGRRPGASAGSRGGVRIVIVNSSFEVGVAQADGRVWITETHVDDLVGALTFAYLAVNAGNAASVMAARVAQIADQLAAQEAEAFLNGA